MQKILTLDFDGVLHEYSSPWTSPAEIADGPVEGAKEFLAGAVKHFDVRIVSTRLHDDAGEYAVRAWCERHFGRAITDRLRFCRERPPSWLTLDDRAVTFTGSWPTIESIENFHPWNRRHEKERL